MPGLTGLISRRPSDDCRRILEQMVATLRYENFYASGVCSEPDLGVYGGWIVHPGSFADCQPIWNEQKDIFLLLAGECFSESETLIRLKRRGHRFDPAGAAYLVHLYEEEGEDFV
jgi:asparagine synthetase B (glutamine-hydrolysing)